VADIEEVITGDTSELVEALQEGTDAATELADALDRIRDALAELDEAGEAAEAAAEELDEVRDAAEQAEAAVDSLSESGAGLDDIAAGASGAAEGLARVRDESAEAEEALDALVATGPGLDDIEAFLEQDAEAAAGLRDNLVEAAAAEDAVTASAAGLGDAAPALEGDAAAAGHLRDNLLEAAAAEEAVTIQGASLDRVLQRVKNNLSTMNVGDELKTLTFSRSGVGWQMVTPELPEDADETLASLADLVKGTDQYRTSVLGLSQDMLSAGQAAGDWEKQIANANAALAEADKFIGSQSGIIDDLGDATSDFVPKFDAETQAIRDFNNAWSDFQASGSWVDLARVQAASEALGPALADASASGEEIEQTFGGIEEAGQGVAAGLADAALGLQDVEQAAGAAASPLEGTTSLLSQLAETAGDAWEKIPWFGVGIGALVVGLLGIAPALVATVSGFVSFGVLAYPALEKVKDGYDAVNKAQTAYEASVAKEKSDPTAAHLADEDKALKSLKATWAGLPTPVSDAVTAIKQFEKAWDQTSAKSGIQNAAIGDISLVLRAATDMLPAFTTLAKAASPVISGLWTNIDKNLDSSGWDKFVSSMAKEAAPAAAAFHTVATGVSDYLSAFQEKGAGASNQFITSFGKLLKTTAPDSVTATINGIKMLTSAINGLNAAAKNPDIDALGHGIDNMLHAGGELDRIGSKFDKAFFTGSYLPPWLSGKPVPVKIGPVDTSALKRSLGESLSTLPPLTPTVNTAALKRSLSIGALDQTVLVHAKVDKVDTTALKQTLSGQSDLFTKAKVNADTSDLQRQVTQASKDVTIGGVKVSLSDAKLSGLAALQPLLGQAGKTAGDDFTKAIIDAITSGDTSAEGAAKRLADDIRSGLSALPGQARSVGIDVGAGLAAGIEASTPGAVAAAASMAAQVEAAARTTLGTHSPSTVFYKIGTETWQGFVLGLQGGKSQVQAAINDVLDQASPYNDSAIQSMID
jgi:hypothetical protein